MTIGKQSQIDLHLRSILLERTVGDELGVRQIRTGVVLGAVPFIQPKGVLSFFARAILR